MAAGMRSLKVFQRRKSCIFMPNCSKFRTREEELCVCKRLYRPRWLRPGGFLGLKLGLWPGWRSAKIRLIGEIPFNNSP